MQQADADVAAIWHDVISPPPPPPTSNPACNGGLGAPKYSTPFHANSNGVEVSGNKAAVGAVNGRNPRSLNSCDTAEDGAGVGLAKSTLLEVTPGVAAGNVLGTLRMHVSKLRVTRDNETKAEE